MASVPADDMDPGGAGSLKGRSSNVEARWRLLGKKTSANGPLELKPVLGPSGKSLLVLRPHGLSDLWRNEDPEGVRVLTTRTHLTLSRSLLAYYSNRGS